MGGIGSGSWWRWNTGPTVGASLALDLNSLVRDGLVGPTNRVGTLHWRKAGTGKEIAALNFEFYAHSHQEGTLHLSYTVGQGDNRRPVETIIWLHTTQPHFGGQRWWFTCPDCARRATKLYVAPGGRLFLCRQCNGLSYASQRENPMYRALSQAQKVRERLGGSISTLDPFPEKPRGMHWRTYSRLRAKAMRYEDRSNLLAARRFGLAMNDLELGDTA